MWIVTLWQQGNNARALFRGPDERQRHFKSRWNNFNQLCESYGKQQSYIRHRSCRIKNLQQNSNTVIRNLSSMFRDCKQRKESVRWSLNHSLASQHLSFLVSPPGWETATGEGGGGKLCSASSHNCCLLWVLFQKTHVTYRDSNMIPNDLNLPVITLMEYYTGK